MGWGDELMAAGQARVLREHDPRLVRIVKPNGAPRTHDAWVGNRDIAAPVLPVDCQILINAPGARPYIAGKTATHWTWREFKPTPARLVLSDEQRAWGRVRASSLQVVIGPTLKPGASPNKDWGWQRWTEFARLARRAGIRLTQLGPAGTPLLPNTEMIETPSMRLACSLLSWAQAFVGHEGGLHHSAAALGVPAVVLFGGYISPAQTGYETHCNLFTGGDPCGWRLPCRHCRKAMADIDPAQVLSQLEVLIGSSNKANRGRVAAGE